jgi:hypothetical protein
MLKRKKKYKKMTATLFASSQKHGKLQIKVSGCVLSPKRNETTPTFANSIFVVLFVLVIKTERNYPFVLI